MRFVINYEVELNTDEKRGKKIKPSANIPITQRFPFLLAQNYQLLEDHCNLHQVLMYDAQMYRDVYHPHISKTFTRIYMNLSLSLTKQMISKMKKYLAYSYETNKYNLTELSHHSSINKCY